MTNNSDSSTPADEQEPLGIDFESTYHLLNTAIEYVQETRSDFEKKGPERSIDDLMKLLQTTLKKIRDLEVEHFDDLIDKKDENGNTYQILIRMQDEKRFDDVIKDFLQAKKEYNAYFDKHLAWLQEQQRKNRA